VPTIGLLDFEKRARDPRGLTHTFIYDSKAVYQHYPHLSSTDVFYWLRNAPNASCIDSSFIAHYLTSQSSQGGDTAPPLFAMTFRNLAYCAGATYRSVAMTDADSAFVMVRYDTAIWQKLSRDYLSKRPIVRNSLIMDLTNRFLETQK
jgi:hypothetical protein